MARTEYYDDPDAPEPNTLVVGVSVAIADENGCVLLQRRAEPCRCTRRSGSGSHISWAIETGPSSADRREAERPLPVTASLGDAASGHRVRRWTSFWSPEMA